MSLICKLLKIRRSNETLKEVKDGLWHYLCCYIFFSYQFPLPLLNYLFLGKVKENITTEREGVRNLIMGQYGTNWDAFLEIKRLRNPFRNPAKTTYIKN